MSAHLEPITLDEFLAWEAGQEERYEFDGIQPVAMTGASVAHMLVVSNLIFALRQLARPGCTVLANDLKIVTQGKVRYPDVTVVCGPLSRSYERIQPTVVFEVLSPSTALTDRRVKPAEYASVASLQAYVILSQDGPRATVLRRSEGWPAELVEGEDRSVPLLEIGMSLPLRDLYANWPFPPGTDLADP